MAAAATKDESVVSVIDHEVSPTSLDPNKKRMKTATGSGNTCRVDTVDVDVADDRDCSTRGRKHAMYSGGSKDSLQIV